MRTRTRGIHAAPDGSRPLNQVYKGHRIFQRLGKVSQAEAEAELGRRRAAIEALEARSGAERVWADGARKYLIECQQRKVRTLELIAYHVQLLLPYIGEQPMAGVCNDSLEVFVNDRLDDGVKNATINRSLEVVRTVMNRAARVWRENRKPWLAAAPLIEMLDESAQARAPRPISWAEQAQLLPRLPAHLADMVEFTLNTGARDENVCGLGWAWESAGARARPFGVQDPAGVLQEQPDAHPDPERRGLEDRAEAARPPSGVRLRRRRERVKNIDLPPAMEYGRIGTMNNTGWQEARKALGLEQVRVHDLRHTFGQRRDAGVSEEDRALLLGHAIEGMPQHYASATVARLVEAGNRVSTTRDRTTLLRVANG